MRFYEECVAVAQQLEKEMNRETQALFMECPFSELWKYHLTLGLWMRNRYLNEQSYLYRALLILGKNTKDEMSMYLLEFEKSTNAIKTGATHRLLRFFIWIDLSLCGTAVTYRVG